MLDICGLWRVEWALGVIQYVLPVNEWRQVWVAQNWLSIAKPKCLN